MKGENGPATVGGSEVVTGCLREVLNMKRMV